MQFVECSSLALSCTTIACIVSDHGLYNGIVFVVCISIDGLIAAQLYILVFKLYSL